MNSFILFRRKLVQLACKERKPHQEIKFYTYKALCFLLKEFWRKLLVQNGMVMMWSCLGEQAVFTATWCYHMAIFVKESFNRLFQKLTEIIKMYHFRHVVPALCGCSLAGYRRNLPKIWQLIFLAELDLFLFDSISDCYMHVHVPLKCKYAERICNTSKIKRENHPFEEA